MHKTKQFILLFVVLAMAAAAFYLENREEKKAAEQYRYLQVQAEQVNHILIQRQLNGHREVLDLSRDPKGWHFKNSVIDGDAKYIQELLQIMQAAEFEEVALVSSAPREQFRFDQPAIQVTVTDHLQHSQSFIMSERKNFEGSPYFQFNGGNQIYTSVPELGAKLMNKLIYFQNKHVFQNQISQFDKIEIQSLNHKLSVFKLKDLDQAKVNAFTTKMKSLTVQEYLTPDIKSKMPKPFMEVVLSSADLTWNLKLALNTLDKKLYGEARVNDNTYYVEYDTSYWEYFSNLNEKQFVKDSK